MAPPQASTTPRQSPLKVIVIILLALIVLVGLVVLITWLILRPKKLVYIVEYGSVHGFSLSHDHLNASFDFSIRAYNPNHRVSIIYESMDVTVSYDNQTLAFSKVKPFSQHHRNVTRIEVKPVAKWVPLEKSVSKDLEKWSGVVRLEVYMKARIRFKVGRWKSRRRTLKVMCFPLVHSSSSMHFRRVRCGVDL